MNTPTCRTCGTDEFLKILESTPGYTETHDVPTSGGRAINRQRPVLPVVEFLCQKCGYHDGHSVPEGWQQKPNPTDAELNSLGEWYKAPGRKVTISAPGVRRETF